MANVLSQDEIDALLNAMDSGEDTGPVEEVVEETTDLQVYDFRTANKFSKEHIKTLKIIFDTYADYTATTLTSVLRAPCELKVVSVEEQKFGEFNNSIPTPTIINVLDIEPFDTSVLMTFSQTTAFAIVSRVFGGEATYKGTDKDFTDIEMVIMKGMFKKLSPNLKEAWSKIVDIKPTLNRIETTSQFTQITALNEPAVLVSISIKIDEVEDMSHFCIPYVALQSLMKKLNTTEWALGSGPRIIHESKRDLIEQDIVDTDCELIVALEDTFVTFADMYNLQVGQVICTNHNINDYITVYMEGKPKFQGVVGVASNKKVIQIAKIIKEQEENEASE